MERAILILSTLITLGQTSLTKTGFCLHIRYPHRIINCSGALETNFTSSSIDKGHTRITAQKLNKSMPAYALDIESFQHSPRSVSILDLSWNSIMEIDVRTFKRFHNTRVVILSHNYIRSDSLDAFDNMIYLQQIELDDNRIQTIPGTFLRGGLNVHTANLQMNQISLIEKHAFCLMSLLRLNLALNHISNLDSLTFCSRSNALERLDMSYNRLPRIPSEAFKNLNHLEKLIITGNPILAINFGDFKGLGNLVAIHVDYMPNLYEIDGKSFVDLPQIETIELHNNVYLRNITNEAFSHNPKLTRLDLHGNELQTLDIHAISRNIKYLDLSGNPWVCDCQLTYLSFLLQSLKTESNVDPAVCMQPPGLRGLFVENLRNGHLKCDIVNESHRDSRQSHGIDIKPVIIITCVLLFILVVIGIILLIKKKTILYGPWYTPYFKQHQHETKNSQTTLL